MPIPFLRPRPPRLSEFPAELRAIEESGVFTNYGPVNRRAEAALTEQVFSGRGGSLLVNNATNGLMLAIREARPVGHPGTYALMPSFTFAATGHAAIWAGLTPLLCDIEAGTWSASADAEDDLLERYAGQIACVVPYACFGNGLDLERYARLAERHGLGVVVDAAASLGSLDADGVGFGAGFPHAVVFSMHATKTFATAEAGLIHSGDGERLARLRAMGNFGFEQPRAASLPGLNAKLSEYGALLVLKRLEGFEAIVMHRAALAAAYVDRLPSVQMQVVVGSRRAYQFMPALLPAGLAGRRDAVIAAMQVRGIQCASYFSPHLAQQPYFRDTARSGPLPVTDNVSARAISLPMADDMTAADVATVCDALGAAMEAQQ
jgi:dTDP-4-amino-4,6-dideoxygalactose transaminase